MIRPHVRPLIRAFSDSALPEHDLLDDAINLLGVEPRHYWDFTQNRALFSGVDVGPVASTPGWSLTRASTGYYTNSDGTLTLFSSGAPRLGDRGILMEGPRTNLCLESQTFDNATWTKTNATISADAIAAPDGTTTADKLVEDATAGVAHSVEQAALSVTVSTLYTVSVYARAGERSIIQVKLTGAFSTAPIAEFNLSGSGTATVRAGVVTQETILALANGWYRCSFTVNPTSTTTTTLSVSLCSAANTASYNGDGASGAYVWGAQLELGPNNSRPASSYIPTTTTSVTRPADALEIATGGIDFPLSLFVEWERQMDTGTGENVIQIDDGSNNNRALLNVSNTDLARAAMFTGGVSQAAITVAGALSRNVVYRSAARFSTNSVQIARDGILGTEDTSATVAATPTAIRIGGDAAGTAQPFGYIRRAAVFNSALSDAQLQTITS